MRHPHPSRSIDSSLTPPCVRAGHSHVVVEQIDSLTSTAVTDPTKFAFFKGLNDPAVNGVLSATVAGGLPEGVYKVRPGPFSPSSLAPFSYPARPATSTRLVCSSTRRGCRASRR